MEFGDWSSLDIYHVVQPIYDLEKQKICGFEFLLRSPQFPNPLSLFKYAEQEQALFDLDMYSIFHIFEQIRQYSRYLNDYLLFINVFPSTLMDDSFLYSLDRLLSFSAIKPENIVLELNETENEHDLPLLKNKIERFRQKGIKISLDDLGTGSSTLRALLELEPDIIKVDRYFCTNLANCEKKQSLIEFFVKFIHDGSILILEGFETEQDLRTAKSLGVTYGQGFYIGSPKRLNEYLFISN